MSSPAYDAAWLRFCATVDKWVAILDMQWVEITLARNDSFHAEEEEVAAATSTKWSYRQADIRAYLPVIVGYTDAQMDILVVHELVHVLVNPMEDELPSKYEKQCELAVESVARAIVAAHGE